MIEKDDSSDDDEIAGVDTSESINDNDLSESDTVTEDESLSNGLEMVEANKDAP